MKIKLMNINNKNIGKEGDKTNELQVMSFQMFESLCLEEHVKFTQNERTEIRTKLDADRIKSLVDGSEEIRELIAWQDNIFNEIKKRKQ